jgi:hypothetical protein
MSPKHVGFKVYVNDESQSTSAVGTGSHTPDPFKEYSSLQQHALFCST